MPSSDTQWKKGQSGNPKGKKPGIGKKRQEFLERMMITYDTSWDALLEKQMEEALSGNQQASRLIFEHLLPKQLPNMPSDEGDGLSFANLKTDEDRRKARQIAEVAYAEIQKLGGVYDS